MEELTSSQQLKLLKAYAKLHDGLSDMVEGGRLTETDIPDDYRWLVKSLTDIAAQWPDDRWGRKD